MDDQNKSLNERWAPGVGATERGYATDPYPSGAYPGERRSTGPPAAESPDGETAHIRSEIDHTRAEMSETIGAIEDRLRPRNIAARAADSLRERTTESVRQAASGARERLPHGMSGGDGFIDRVRENPIPAALAAASLTWLAFAGRREGNGGYSPAIYGSTAHGEPFIRETRISMDPAIGQEDGRGAVDTLRETAGQAVERTQYAVSHARAQARDSASRVEHRVVHAAQDNPLLAGAIAALAGLAVGMALPVTERENAVMGETRDKLVDRGRETVRETTEKAKDVAQDVQRLVTRSVGGSTEPGT